MSTVMGAGGARGRTWIVPRRPEAVGRARDEVRKALADWGVPEAVDDTCLIVSELVGNAVRHGEPEIRLTLATDGARVTGSVFDRGAGMPRVRQVTGTDVSGRGLWLVGAVATAWGVVPESDGLGKTVWWIWSSSGAPSH
jgi:anti-sigma regulatory factor (Ser/Thr protein kinase)